MIKSALQSTPVQLPISVLKPTILLVEHNGVIRTIIAHMLREIGSNVVEAVSACHAINLLQTSLQTELLFIDSEIADMTPDDLCGRAKALLPSLKFLIAIEPLSTICMDGSDWDHIEKPFGQDDVASALERMFEIPNAC